MTPEIRLERWGVYFAVAMLMIHIVMKVAAKVSAILADEAADY
jgi:hypothetical protein